MYVSYVYIMVSMTVEMSVTQVRTEFAEVINRVRYGRERVLVTRHGNQLVAIIPADELERLETAAATDHGPIATPERPQLLQLSSDTNRPLIEYPAAHHDPS